MHTVLSSPSKTVTIGHDQPFVIIGERINPTGRKKYQEQLRAGDLSTVEIDVADQIAAGCDMLDINMGVPLADEPELLAAGIKLVQSKTDVPLCIDSSVVEALEAGLAVYEGKALVNSVTGEDDRLEAILPLVKKYGAAIVALPHGPEGLAYRVEERLHFTEKIMRACESYGIPLEDLVIDPLAMPVGAPPEDGLPHPGSAVFETIATIKARWGLNMTLGASNVSFGMPGRHVLNSSFITMAMAAGLTSAIMDGRTPAVIESVRCGDLMLGNDEYGGRWIRMQRAKKAAQEAAAAAAQ